MDEEHEQNDRGDAAPSSEDEGPELSKLEPPPRWGRRITLGVMGITALVCALAAWSLSGEALYSLREHAPLDLGELRTAELVDGLANRFVRAQATLESAPTVRYHRLGDADRHVLCPVAGKPGLWIEHRVPERWDGPRFVPPTRFAGRLVRARDLGAGYWGLAKALEAANGPTVAPGAWLLLDGTDPRGSSWALALALLLCGFTVWNVAGILHLSWKHRVR